VSIVPSAPISFDASDLATSLNVSAEDADDVLQLAVTTLNRELTGAFRDVPQEVYDDMCRRIAGGIVGSRKRPAGGAGQLTRTDQPGQSAPTPAPRDYVTPVRPTLALYVAPL
jgi:hypothetical protein